jgi:hypothetical protein
MLSTICFIAVILNLVLVLAHVANGNQDQALWHLFCGVLCVLGIAYTPKEK